MAAGISPLDSDAEAVRAGRIMLELEDYHAASDHSFAIETTLSGKSYVQRIKTWQQLGHRVDLIYIALPNVEVAIERVRHRVLEGGHNVPEAVIRRRFVRSWANFSSIYRDLTDSWLVIDNSSGKSVIIDGGGW